MITLNGSLYRVVRFGDTRTVIVQRGRQWRLASIRDRAKVLLPALRVTACLALLATTAHAETCQAPNVARVIEGILPPMITMNNAIMRVPRCELACPTEGPCHHVCEVDPPPLRIVCLTPAENKTAEVRGR